jgi:hypothetical protein
MKKIDQTNWKINEIIEIENNSTFFETDEYLVQFSNIDEYGMLKFLSPIEIWKNKTNPIKIFENKKILFEYQYDRSCYFLKKSNLIVLLLWFYEPVNNSYKIPYILFDFNKNLFAILNYSNFDLIEKDASTIELKINFRWPYNEETQKIFEKNNKKIINLNQIKWLTFDKLNEIEKHIE